MIIAVLGGMLGGFLGSAHCLGMCGGIAGALGLNEIPVRSLFVRHLAYNLGRTATYTFMGALAGSTVLMLSSPDVLVHYQRVLSIAAGILMVVVGCGVLGLFPVRIGTLEGVSQLVGQVFKTCMSARSVPAFFSVGVLNGFMPCGLVYAFLALALASADTLTGMAIMLGFGCGTIPAMMTIGCGVRLLSGSARRQVLNVAAYFVIVFGVTTVARGVMMDPSQPCPMCDGSEAATAT